MQGSSIAIVGAGSWGTALAFCLARNGHSVRLWTRREALAEEIRRSRENKDYLPGFKLPESVLIGANAQEILGATRTIVSVVPSHTVRGIFGRLKPYVARGATILSATKGIENDTCLLMTDVIQQALGDELEPRVAVLSGPSFALEVARGDPTAAVVASRDQSLASVLQGHFSGSNIRIYTNSDPIGTQIGGAVKNIIAIAAGIINGLGFGSNTCSALITRGLAELKRLCAAAGGTTETLSGLAGLGDLVLTATGTLSRNRHLGVELGRGRKLQEILSETRFVAEGVRTTLSTYAMAKQLEIEMPITEQIYSVLYAEKPPLQAISDLMGRELKGES